MLKIYAIDINDFTVDVSGSLIVPCQDVSDTVNDIWKSAIFDNTRNVTNGKIFSVDNISNKTITGMVREYKLFYAQNSDIENARSSFQKARKLLGNQFAFQYDLFTRVQRYNILSPSELQEYKNFIISRIPTEYLQEENRDNRNVQKFFKHHADKIVSLFQ